MSTNGHIRILATPDGEGYESETYRLANRRSNFVDCCFSLADPTTVRHLDAEFFANVEIEPSATYAVAFDDVIAGLRAGNRYDCADYLMGLKYRPRLVRFPIACAELIQA